MPLGKWERISALTGALAALLIVAAAAVQGRMPTADASGQDMSDFFTSNHQRIWVAMFFRLFAGFAFMWFLGTLRSVLARAEGGTARLANVAFGAGVVMMGSSGLATVLLGSGAFRAADGVNPLVATVLIVATYMCYTITAMALAWLLFASHLVAARTKVLPTWIGWLGTLIGVVIIAIPIFSFGSRLQLTSNGLVPIWIILVSGYLWFRPSVDMKAPATGQAGAAA